ncbi:hypothetical protein RJ639_006405 [Escallonia herrerae]|uniref:G3BP-like protein n=1 Tax=Escallonia herrerae TaxID=1293975 RepID=A0AA88VZZ5_9ASTE|nr:hypothetical protein RJ639_006405 [Escallonia herrerae]
MAALQPVSAQVVGNAFVQQYYQILHHSPGLVHKFYQDISKLGRPEEDGTMSITTTMKEINDKILSLSLGEFRAEIKSVDAQESLHAGVQVLVTGYLTGEDGNARNFTQTFFLAPQEKGYFVLNDMFRYVESPNHHDANQVPVSDVEAPLNCEQGSAEPSAVQENHILEQTTVGSEEANGEEEYNLPENGDVSVVEKEVPVAEVVNEVLDDSQMVVELNIKIEEVPKKSYASIVMDLKGSDVAFSPPAPVLRKSLPRSQEQQVNQVPPTASQTEVLLSGSDAIENGNSQEGEAEGYSIYVRGLPMNATPALLEEEFKRFGPIKSGGIQVRNSRPLFQQQAVCFGFVEFEVASAVQNAIEASPIEINGRQAIVEEKRSTYSSRTNNRGRFVAGRSYGFRNDGMRGRSYGGGRGFSRGDSGGRNEFGNRNNNRGGEGYQRSDSMGSNGGRFNRSGGVTVNGTAKNMAPRVSATA